MHEHKRICCLAAPDIASEAMVLLDEIQSRIHLTIPILGIDDSIADYEVVFFFLSDGAYQDEAIQTLLKDAIGLNKTFLPAIIGSGWLKNWLLKRKFKGMDFHSQYYYLNNVRDILILYTQLMAFSGATVVGDPFGREYIFGSDVDCQVIRNNIVIAEILAGQSKGVTFYLGKHRLSITSAALDQTKEINLTVDDIIKKETIRIDTKFIPDVTITSSIDFLLVENERHIADIRANEEKVIKLLPGTHKLKFQHPVHKNLNRYITVKIKVDGDIGIVYNFPYSPKVCS